MRRKPSFVLALLVTLATTLVAAPTAVAAPTCAEGPQTVGDTIVGTPCDDTIHAAAGVSVVNGGPGDDTIVPAAIASATPFPGEQWLGVGSQTFEGGPGDDLVFGERGNDTLLGGAGDDRLYGGIGDDLLRGGAGQDQLAGGHGADSIDGDAGDDYVRGDGTKDRIYDTGGGTDTLSYSTGITPGFTADMFAFPGFPLPGGERGVRLDLGAGGQNGSNGTASFGGGVDEVEGQSFERVIGTAFSDYIVGTEDPEAIYGGGGADVIIGEGGSDTLVGGADGDHLDGGDGTGTLDGGPGEDHCEDGAATKDCEAKSSGVVVRNTSKISVGFAVAPGTFARSQLYLVGSTASDSVTATYPAGPPATVTFEAGSTGAFDASPSAVAECDPPTGSEPEQVVCTLGSPLESIVMAGMGGADELHTTGFPSTVSVMVLGGAGGDDLLGGDATEDVLVDGDATDADEDVLTALGRDDALLHNAGSDKALIDIPSPSEEPPYADPVPVSCELVEEAEVNSFRFKTQLPPPPPPEEETPTPAPAPPASKVQRDKTAPRTRITSHPPKRRLIDKRRVLVAFRFNANETGATFRCRIDRQPFRPCHSPRIYRLGPGPHAFRVYAIDRAGNRDRSPARFEFRIRRR